MNVTLLKNRSHPPGGWQYYCPMGEMDFPPGFAFEVQVQKIRAYRAANPSLNLPADYGAVRNELLRFTFARLRNRIGMDKALEWFSVTDTDDVEIAEFIKKKLPNLSSEVPELESAKPAVLAEDARITSWAEAQRWTHGLPEQPAGMFETIKTGVKTLADWVGDGANPVSPSIAQARTDTCLVCPRNKAGNWMARLAAGIATAIKEQVAVKADMGLKVENEEKLLTCAACNCFLPLKVWVPIETIKGDMSESQMGRLHKDCWILKEAK